MIDSRGIAQAEQDSQPSRKQFAARHLNVYIGLTAVALCAATIVGVGWVSDIVKLQASAIGILTITYFVLFRLFSNSGRLPWKEISIGFCFAAGVGLPYYSDIYWLKIGALVLFGILCAGNCLVISLVEKDYDESTDPSAWFAVKNRKFPFLIVFGVTFVGALCLWLAGAPLEPCMALMISSVGLSLLHQIKGRYRKRRVQNLADAALWLPAVGFVLVKLSALYSVP